MRAYERTHPFLTFALNANSFTHRLWMRLGEAKSKCEHVAGVPLRPDVAKRLNTVFLAKGALATTAIEGNTLSEAQVLASIERRLDLPRSQAYLQDEVRNVVDACNWIIESLLADDVRLDIECSVVRKFNHDVLKGLSLDEDVVPGEVRRHSVGVGGYRGAPAEDCPYLLHRLCQWLREDWSSGMEEFAVEMAIVKAVVAHLYLAWIHPFGDGNGRTARLLEFYILVHAGVPVPAAHLLSDHYNKTRTAYYRELDRSHGSGGDVIPFLEYAVSGFVDGLADQLSMIRRQQWDVAWRGHVHDTFKTQDSPAARRRKHFVLDLSRTPDWVPIQDAAAVSRRVAEAYAGRTRKTLTRDLRELVERGLVEMKAGAVRANREMILAFLPARRPATSPRNSGGGS
ncbi:Fic family protein [bacterium]|nr:Fic family protein [bacterium]